MILVVSHAGDEHYRAVAAALARAGAAHALLDTARFPQETRLALAYGGGGRSTLELPGGTTVHPGEVSAVWWRRPLPYVPHPERQRDAGLVRRECHEAMAGMWLALDALWVNHPSFDEAATHKPYPLALAERLGLIVPATLVANDPARARAFVEARAPARLVHKTLSATPDDWRETRFVGPAELAGLGGVRYAPVIFQEYVEGVDLRATFVGERVFVAEIDARETSCPHDCRVDFEHARVAPVELPQEIEALLRRLVSHLRLRYAAIDLRRRPGGEHVFLELNPAGQWLFVEERTGQPIAAAVAELLMGARPA
jgi:glutathione synthase/RimK-type ligase-like ATP-grasp enzyme